MTESYELNKIKKDTVAVKRIGARARNVFEAHGGKGWELMSVMFA